MKADSLKISRVFSGGGDVHYFLPYFQREYAWNKENWQTLANDIFALYETYNPEKEPEHFMGALVVINDGTRNGVVPVFKLVDGQQRLTTVSLFLCALGRLVSGTHPQLNKKIRRMLTNPDEIGDLHFKLLPTTKYGDRQAYLALLNGEEIHINTDSQIPEAYRFFCTELENRLAQNKVEPERLFIVLSNCLQVVFIDLNQDERPYEIFESLNAKGKPLSQADLVRNYIAMKLPEARQGEVFEKYWSKIEDMLQEKRTVGRSRLGELTAFIRHYLGFRMGILINEQHVYARFRDRVENEIKTPAAFESEVATLKRFAEYYDRLLRPEKEPNTQIRTLLNRLKILEISTAYPLLLGAYDALSNGKISQADFMDCLRILENYLVRRYIAGEPTNYTNKMFPSLWKEVETGQFVENLKRDIIKKAYPVDHRLRQAVITEQLYDKRSETRSKVVLILESINRHLSIKVGAGAYTVLSDDPTIEHIMPQTLDPAWKEELGANWEQTYRDYRDTLGNLTLVTQEWNSTLSNSSFVIKKVKLSAHGLKINSDYFSQPIHEWNETAIRTRAEWLACQVLEIWPELGTPPVHGSTTTAKPKLLTLIGQSFPVNSWRDVAYFTAQAVASLVDDFDLIAVQYPAYFDRQEFRGACRQLPNGWWLYVNLSAASVQNFCKNLIASADLSEDEWQVEVE